MFDDKYLFLFGVGVLAVLYLFTLFYMIILCTFVFLDDHWFLLNFAFQLSQKPPHKTDGKSFAAYDDGYETGRGSTV